MRTGETEERLSRAFVHEPAVSRNLSTREQIILLEGSKLNGSVFPPWVRSEDTSHLCKEVEFVDSPTLPVSRNHAALGVVWKKVSDLIKSERSSALRSDTDLDDSCEKHDLVQDVATDCSVVASLCAVTSRAERGYSDILQDHFYPWDDPKDQPLVQGCKFLLRFFFNGCYRKVVIDDRLPILASGRSLFVVDRNHSHVFWPALLEKAYLKVQGGYDFPGSNSGIDLWIITGWIPEQLFVDSDDLDRSALWRKLLSAFSFGDVLITLGTGKMSVAEEKALGIAGEHDYAVLDLKEQNGQRVFLIKNPWSYATSDEVTGSDVQCDPATLNKVEVQDLLPGERLSLSHTEITGTFHMTLDQVLQNFSSIYLNWNPGLFAHREDMHVEWDLSGALSSQGSFRTSPQFKLHGVDGGPIWLLLSKHYTSRNEKSAEQSSLSSKRGFDGGFISLYAFENEGRRVHSAKGVAATSKYTDSMVTLLKMDSNPGSTYTIAASQQSLCRALHTFSLSCFSRSKIALALADEEYAHKRMQNGAWTDRNTGGNTSTVTYHTNPQYLLRLSKPASVCIELKTTLHNVFVHVQLLWRADHLFKGLKKSDILGDSGEYQKSFAVAEIRNIPAGLFNIVCSTFEKGQLGSFELHISATAECAVDRLPSPNAGQFITSLDDAVFQPGIDRVSAKLVSNRLNRITLFAHSRDAEAQLDGRFRSPLKAFIRHGRGASARELAISDEHNEPNQLFGEAWLRDINIKPTLPGEDLYLVLDRLSVSSQKTMENVVVELYSEAPLLVRPWTAEAP